MRLSPLFLFVAAPIAWGQGQAMEPASSGSKSSEPTATGINVAPSSVDPEATSNLADNIFNPEEDAVDLENGVLNWKGKQFNLGDSRAMRARFERYLASPPLAESDEEYLKVLQEISNLLSLVDARGVKDSEQLQDGVFEAWQKLFEAGQYDLDQEISLVLANQVYNVWRIRDETSSLNRANRVLRQEQYFQSEKIVGLETAEKRRFEERQRATAQGADTGEIYEGEGSRRALLAERLAEINAKIASTEAAAATSGIQAKLQFQSTILSLLTSRRYDHARIGANLYRFVFKGSHQDLQVGQEELAGFFPSDFSPTVNALDMLAREAKQDVATGMETVESLMAAGDDYSALERLQETYFLGEHSPPVMTFSPEKKRDLLELYRNLRDLKNLLENKDLASAETVVEKIRDQAADFPSTQVISTIRSVEQASNMALLGAQRAFSDGEFEKGEQGLQRALRLWPLNPALKKFTDTMSDQVDLVKRETSLFDDAWNRADFRAIYDKRNRYIAALMRDERRSGQLETAVNKVAQIDFLIAQAEQMAKGNNFYAAWETVTQAESIDPEDPELLKQKAALAPKVPAFVGALDRAVRAEKEGRLAVSLAQYLKAQKLYPASAISLEGIERVSRSLLTQLTPANES